MDPKERVLQTNAATPVVVWSKTYCGYSARVLRLLASLEPRFPVDIVEVDVDPQGHEVQAALLELTGSMTVPHVFINGVYQGGCTETTALHEKGLLQPAIAAAVAAHNARHAPPATPAAAPPAAPALATPSAVPPATPALTTPATVPSPALSTPAVSVAVPSPATPALTNSSVTPSVSAVASPPVEAPADLPQVISQATPSSAHEPLPASEAGSDASLASAMRPQVATEAALAAKTAPVAVPQAPGAPREATTGDSDALLLEKPSTPGMWSTESVIGTDDAGEISVPTPSFPAATASNRESDDSGSAVVTEQSENSDAKNKPDTHVLQKL